MDVFSIELDSMSGKTTHKTVYVSNKMASKIAKSLEGEFVGSRINCEKAEEISDNRVIIDRTVYNLDKTTDSQVLFENIVDSITGNPEKQMFKRIINKLSQEDLEDLEISQKYLNIYKNLTNYHKE